MIFLRKLICQFSIYIIYKKLNGYAYEFEYKRHFMFDISIPMNRIEIKM